MWQGQERRLHPRVAFQAEALLQVDDVDFGRFAVRDISVGGALVIGSTALSVGQLVKLTLVAPQFGTVRLEAEVARVMPHGSSFAAGIAFRRPPSQIAHMIEEVVLSELAALERASQVG
jgi:cephalosporin-C deacetylase-like acetyl esterase